MRFGTFHLHSIPPWSTPTDVVHDQFAQMLAAEEHGFHELWLAEHNGRDYGMIGDTTQLAAALAAATTRIRIATAVARLPLHHPLHLAENLAYADVLSQGRMDWGVGKGYDLLEFGSYGIDFEHREERWQETLDAVRHMFATGRTGFDGRFYQLADASLVPRPYRGTLPTYIMVSGSVSSVAWAAEHLLPIASGSGVTPEELRTRLSMYAEIAQKAGHSDDAINSALNNCWQLKPMHVADTTERAIAEYQKGLEWYMAELGNRSMFGFAREPRPYQYFVEHHSVMLGSPDKVLDELGTYLERSGVNGLICWFNMGGQPHAQVLEALALTGEHIIPALADREFDWAAGSVQTTAAGANVQ